MKAFTTSVLVALLLSACAPAPEPVPIAVPPGIDPMTVMPVDLTPGLNDREPDTCHAADYVGMIGQPEGAVGAAGIMRPTRVVPMNGIVSQEEYDSFRINFHLDSMGNVARISCG